MVDRFAGQVVIPASQQRYPVTQSVPYSAVQSSGPAPVTQPIPGATEPAGTPVQTITLNTKLQKHEYQTVTASTAYRVLDYSASNGNIVRFWFAIAGADVASVLNSTITVTRDGEGTPAINAIKLSDITASRNIVQVANGVFIGTRWYNVNGYVSLAGQYCGMYQFDLSVPFDTSITVDVTNAATASTMTLFSQVFYQTGSANFGPYSRCHAVYQSSNVSAYAEQTLADVTCSTTSALWSVYTYLQGGDSNYNYLEGNFKIYLNGEGAASWESSGTEDFFLQAFGFSAVTTAPRFNDYAGCTWLDHTATVGAYRIFCYDPILFNSEIKITWTNGEASHSTVTNPTTCSSLVIYYTGS